MTSNRITVGIDHRSGFYYAARVQQHASGPQVTALVKLEKSHLNGHHLFEEGELILAVPDNEVVVKNLHLNQTGSCDVSLQAQFEMSQSMLDQENEFCFDAVCTGSKNRYLSLATRRRHLERLTHVLFPQTERTALSPRYQMRTVALGKGYLNFCHPEEGEFVCLSDFSNDVTSICFILEGNIVGLAYQSTSQFDLATEEGLKKVAVEFKTIVNFKLASICENGVSVPLSALVVSGDISEVRIRSALEQYFPVVVTTPRINSQFLADSSKASDIPLENYLVALGLTVN